MKNILTLAVLFSALLTQAQDAIYKKDKTKLDAKVLEVGNWDIKYKPAANPDGPVYTMPKSDIVIIIYQNGRSDIFSSSEKSPSCKKFDSLSVNFCHNSIGIDIGEFTNTAMNITYEHTFKKGNFALRIPFSVGMTPYNYGYGYYGDQKIFSTGLDFLFFPTGQGKVRYYVAPYAEFGMYNFNNGYVLYDGYNNPSYYNYHFSGYRIEGGVKNGILIQPTRHFSISADLGFGIKTDQYYYRGASPCARANLILAYKF